MAAIAILIFVISVGLASNASAAVTRQPSGTTFGPAGTGAGAFEAVRSIAVDPSDGSIYVLDSAEGGSLYKFDSGGEPSDFSSLATNVIKGVAGAGERESEIAVAPPGAAGGTAGDIYIASFSSAVSVYGESGTKLGEFGEPSACGVAVDTAGQVYVGSFASVAEPNNLARFTPTANPPTDADLSGQSAAEPKGICNVALGSSGTIYASNYFETNVARIEGLSDSEPTFISPGGSAIAVDQTDGVLNVDRRNEIRLYDDDGSPDGTFGGSQLSGSTAIAVSGNSSAAYVADGSTGRIEAYGPALTTPDVQLSSPSSVTDDSALLQGTVNAAGGPSATCQFEYATRAMFESQGFEGAQVAPCSPSGPFTGTTTQQVTAAVSGLARVTEYRVRLTASNANGKNSATESFTSTASPFGPEPPSFAGSCPSNESLRAGPGAHLPDCRAYEQVSPVDKNGAGVEGLSNFAAASPTGSAVTYFSQAESTIPAEGGTQDFPNYLARVEGDQWVSQRLLPSQETGEVAYYLGTSPDTDFTFAQAGSLDGGKALFEIDTITGTTTRITPYVLPEGGSGAATQIFAFAGCSSDGSLVFFESKTPVPTGSGPQPVPGADNLYVWSRDSGEISLAGVLPGVTPEPPAGGSFAGGYDWYSTGSTSVGGAFGHLTVAAHHAISPDGDQVYFTSAGNAQLYLRRGIDGSGASTVRVSAPEPGVVDPFAPLPAAFQEATPDGSRVFFTSQEKLTVDATTGPEDEGTDLYRWDAGAEKLTDITPDSTEENGARVQGLLGVSEDGTSGYFIARGVLSQGATSGRENLYRFSEDPSSHVIAMRFIGSLNASGEQGPDRRNVSPIAETQFNVEKTSRVSPDGDVLLFASTAPLTGFDSTSKALSGGLDCEERSCAELFRFSAGTGSLDCVSCNPTGASPRGAASLQSPFIETFLVPAIEPQAGLSRNLSAAGNRIFFQSPDRLVAEDTNGVASCRGYNEGNITGPAYCQDVYEWEAPGTGSCRTVEVNGGCIYLLSTGKSGRASYFVGASTDGDVAFLDTASQLVPQDGDAVNDTYAARVDGGLPAQSAVSPVPCASESACHGQSAAPPPGQQAGTASFVGPENSVQKPATACKKHKKGKKGKQGRCIKKGKKAKKHKKGKKKTAASDKTREKRRARRLSIPEHTKPNLEVAR